MDTKLDSYYQNLLNHCGDMKILEAAGYIEEPKQIAVSLDIPKGDDNEVILLLTGCFAPAHLGHIESLTLAKEEIEKLGYKVNLGFLGLCHDNYVITKTKEYPLEKRLEVIKNITKNNEWIKPYTWEARQNGAMNFTSVIDSIKRKTKSKVVFVYGSDNFNFRLAFLNNELNICVERMGIEKFKRYLPEIITNTIYIKNNINKTLSSSLIRDNR